MHAVATGIGGFDRQERARPDMQRHGMECDAARLEAIDQGISEM
jgi:hypothetical protein